MPSRLPLQAHLITETDQLLQHLLSLCHAYCWKQALKVVVLSGSLMLIWLGHDLISWRAAAGQPSSHVLLEKWAHANISLQCLWCLLIISLREHRLLQPIAMCPPWGHLLLLARQDCPQPTVFEQQFWLFACTLQSWLCIVLAFSMLCSCSSNFGEIHLCDGWMHCNDY